MRVLRIYHGGRIPAHRARERALVDAGADVVLVVPAVWPEAGSEDVLTEESFRVVALPVTRAGDVNRHRYAADDVRRVLAEEQPDVLDVHEEPFSLAARQWLGAAPSALPVALYTAQNLDKRFPPPFHAYERAALRRAQAVYPCSRQAASVVRGKGFAGRVDVLPLGYDDAVFTPGDQSLEEPVVRLGLVGRMLPEKGVLDAVRVLAAVHARRPARLALVGDGPELAPARALARDLGVADRLDEHPWVDTATLAALYRSLHVVLVPSVATSRWVEQFGRVIVEAQASGAVVAGYVSGAIPEVVGGAGVLAAEGDVTGLSHAVVRLVDDADRWRRLRRAGLDLAPHRTWRDVARRHADLLAAAVRSPGPPAPTGRDAAVAEFGTPARHGLHARPFALPVLRESVAAERVLGGAIDLGRGVRERLRD